MNNNADYNSGLDSNKGFVFGNSDGNGNNDGHGSGHGSDIGSGYCSPCLGYGNGLDYSFDDDYSCNGHGSVTGFGDEFSKDFG